VLFLVAVANVPAWFILACPPTWRRCCHWEAAAKPVLLILDDIQIQPLAEGGRIGPQKRQSVLPEPSSEVDGTTAEIEVLATSTEGLSAICLVSSRFITGRFTLDLPYWIISVELQL